MTDGERGKAALKNLKGKKNRGGGANWMDTYGDMVTLLLCFFVRSEEHTSELQSQR